MTVGQKWRARLLHGIYQLLLHAALPWLWLRLGWLGRAERRGERFGAAPAVATGAIWVHSVSAGETIASAPLVRQLAARVRRPLLLTTTTLTGSQQVSTLHGDSVDHCYAPYDYPWAVRRFLERVQPAALLLMETELWPNLLRQCQRRGVPVYLVNARLSERSARGYRRVGALTRSMLDDLAHVYCQYDDHQRRFLALGMAPRRITVTGSVKFDVDLPADLGAQARQLRRSWAAARAVWIAGSTHRGEDEVLLAAHRLLKQRWPELLLVLVPRHPERFDEVALLAAESFSVARLSAGADAAAQGTDVLIGDAMGRLLYLYGMADVAFVGGSLVANGGHNPIEPAIHGVPMLMGPERFNFDEVCGRFAAADCLHEVVDAASIQRLVAALLGDPDRCAREGAAAVGVVEANVGATTRLADLLSRELSGTVSGSAYPASGTTSA